MTYYCWRCDEPADSNLPCYPEILVIVYWVRAHLPEMLLSVPSSDEHCGQRNRLPCLLYFLQWRISYFVCARGTLRISRPNYLPSKLFSCKSVMHLRPQIRSSKSSGVWVLGRWQDLLNRQFFWKTIFVENI